MAIELVGVSHGYGRHTALHDVNLHVPDGCSYGFLGHNGAGKTTAMRIALGLLQPTRGYVQIDGQRAKKWPLHARTRSRGLVETPGFYPTWSGRANLTILAAAIGLSGKARRAHVDELLERVGLTAHAHRRAGNYSQGMRQRLGIAIALLGQPQNIILDEPMSGLDPEGIAEIRGLLRTLTQDEGRTLLISSHQLTELEGLCDHVGILHQGRLLMEGPSADLLAELPTPLVLNGEPIEALEAALVARGMKPEVHPEGLRVLLDQREPGQLLQQLVRDEVPLTAFAPRRATLEDLYFLAVSRKDDPAAPQPRQRPSSREREDAGPSAGERTRPPSPFRAYGRALRYESHRALRSVGMHLGFWLSLLVTALMNSYFVSGQHEALQAKGADPAMVGPTAFEVLGEGVSYGWTCLGLFAVALASVAVAGERGAGTLKNIATLPLGRWNIGLAKWTVLSLWAAFSYSMVYAVSYISAASLAEFKGVSILLPNGKPYQLVDEAALWPEVHELFWTPFPALFALVAIGFAVGSVFSRAATALSAAVGGLFLMEVLQSVLKPVAEWLPQSSYPSMLGSQFYLDYYSGVVRGGGDAIYEFAESVEIRAVLLAITGTLLGMVVLRQKSIR